MGTLIEKMSVAVTALPKGDERTALATAVAHLSVVRIAWRNEVMHPKATYTEEEAATIFEHTKAFSATLAEILLDAGPEPPMAEP